MSAVLGRVLPRGLRALPVVPASGSRFLASLSAGPFPVPLFDSLGAAHRTPPLLFRCASLAVLVLALATDLVVLLALGPVDFALYSLLFTVVLVLVDLGFSGLQAAADRSVAASRTGAEAPFPTPLLTARLWRSWGILYAVLLVLIFLFGLFITGPGLPFSDPFRFSCSSDPGSRCRLRRVFRPASSPVSVVPRSPSSSRIWSPESAFFLVVILLFRTAVPLASTGAAAPWLLAFAAALGVAVILFRRSRNAPLAPVSDADPGARSTSDEGPSRRVWWTSISAWFAGAGGVELLDQTAPAGGSSAARSGRCRGLRVRERPSAHRRPTCRSNTPTTRLWG